MACVGSERRLGLGSGGPLVPLLVTRPAKQVTVFLFVISHCHGENIPNMNNIQLSN